MAEPAYQFTSDAVPRVYDELLVPRLFGPWAELLLDAVAIREGDAVLDVATGPGTVARADAAATTRGNPGVSRRGGASPACRSKVGAGSDPLGWAMNR